MMGRPAASFQRLGRLLRLHLLRRQLARVAALGLRARDAEVEPVRAEALDLLAHDRADVEAGDDGAEPARGRERLQARDARADHEHLRRRDGPGRGHQHREEAGEMLRGEQRALVAADRRLRRERVHRLRARRARDRLHRERDHAARREPLDALAVGERVEIGDQELALAQPRSLGVVRLRTFDDASASHGEPSVTPASVYASSGNEAASPAPGSTTISKPAAASFPAVSGTRATLRSPGAVSRATPTLIAGNHNHAEYTRAGGALLHPPRAAAALRRGDARVVRVAASRRDRAHLLRRARLARGTTTSSR